MTSRNVPDILVGVEQAMADLIMYFDESFIKSLPDEWPLAIVQIAERFNSSFRAALDANKHLLAQELLLLLKVYCRKKNLQRPIPRIAGRPDVDISTAQNIIGKLAAEARGILEHRKEELRLSNCESAFAIALGGEFYYEFSEGDLRRIQVLVNELRDLISGSEELQASHKRRILSRLEKLQSELHKTVSDVDRIYGSLIELSITAGIIGENLKPITERIREIIGIVWPVQTRAFDLPSNMPFRLPGQSEQDESVKP